MIKNLYRKILREGALRFCKLYAIEQRRAAELLGPGEGAAICKLMHFQNAVAAEAIVREITIERTNDLYNKYDFKTTSNNENETRRHQAQR